MLLVTGAASLPARGQGSGSIVPDAVALDDAARAAIDAEWITPEERADLRVFHGVWDERDLTTLTRRALVALNAWRFDDPSLTDPAVPVEVRAEALLRRGEAGEAIRLLDDATGVEAARIRAEAHALRGEFEEALKAAREPIQILQAERVEGPKPLVEGVRTLIVRAEIEGQPARDYRAMMDLLARARTAHDRLHWPAHLVEARLLREKDNLEEAVKALHETLALNPRQADAWHMLGEIAVTNFDFDAAAAASRALRRLNPRHPLADLVDARVRLVERDPEGALAILMPLLDRHPRLRDALALRAAAEAVRYDFDAMHAALDRCDEASPGAAAAWFTVGRYLALHRQYEEAAEVLGEAVRRQPNWPAPRIEMGLLRLQSGHDDAALDALEAVAELDPFNKRAANSLHLLRELATYATIETEHFRIRFQEGPDRALAEIMAPRLERIHEIVSSRFRHEPDRKTTIELMPDHPRFAVRITGMPWIHTIAACTGPVIALEAPKEGPPNLHHGLFDWPRVVQHEYTHTITLSQTRNRIPHWFTEAAAVSMEHAPRSFETAARLARAWRESELFDLDEINWAFIRPERPGDRSLAYAQGHWMVEYMNERFGEDALVRLLEWYFNGEREAEAMPAVLGVSRERFHRDFLAWAGERVREWGLAPEPSLREIEERAMREDPSLASILETSRQARLDAVASHLSDLVGRPTPPRGEPFTADRWPDLQRPEVELTDEQLDRWLVEFPDHPDLLELKIRRAVGESGAPDASLVPTIERYARIRPLDPFPHKLLAIHYRETGEGAKAIPHLEVLDAIEQASPVYAEALRDLYREADRPEAALAKAMRAVHIDPYDARNREVAAAVAVEAGDLELARTHIVALTLLEPDRPQHERRLKAIEALLTTSATERAR